MACPRLTPYDGTILETFEEFTDAQPESAARRNGRQSRVHRDG